MTTKGALTLLVSEQIAVVNFDWVSVLNVTHAIFCCLWQRDQFAESNSFYIILILLPTDKDCTDEPTSLTPTHPSTLNFVLRIKSLDCLLVTTKTCLTNSVHVLANGSFMENDDQKYVTIVVEHTLPRQGD